MSPIRYCFTVVLVLLLQSVNAQDCCSQNAYDLQQFSVQYDPVTDTTRVNSTTFVSPLIADLDDNGIVDPEVITVGISDFAGGEYTATEIIITPNNVGPNAQIEVIPVNLNFANFLSLAAGNVLPDFPGSELVYIDANDSLHLISNISNLNNIAPISYVDNAIGLVSESNRVPLIADLDEDGVAEIYVSGDVFYRTGPSNWDRASITTSNVGSREYRVRGSTSENSTLNAYSAYPNPVETVNERQRYNLPLVVDILSGVPGKELIVGNQIFSFNGTSLTLEYDANDMPIARLNAFDIDTLQDGYVSVGDVDGDNELEVVVNGTVVMTDSNTYFGLYVYDPEANDLEAFIHSTSTGSTTTGHESGRSVTLAEIDPDVPGAEIIWLETNQISIHNTTLSTENFSYWITAGGTQEVLQVQDNSGLTGITTFDFNGDGSAEIVYRDERNIRVVYGGNDQGVLNQLEDSNTRNWFVGLAGSGTGAEFPVIADYDADGEAEIITVGSNTIRDNSGSVRIFESSGVPWNATVPYWNQNQYYHVNVETPDLESPLSTPGLNIPASQVSQLQPVGGRTPYNLFMGQPSIIRDSIIFYPDLTLEVSASDCNTVTLNICNLCGDVAPANVKIEAFDADPFFNASATSLGSFTFTPSLAAGACETLTVPTSGVEGEWYFMLNDDAGNNPIYQISANGDFNNADFNECSFENNLAFTSVFCADECPSSLTLTNTSEADCCPSLSFTNNGVNLVNGIRFTLLDGVTFDPAATISPAGYQPFDFSPGSRVFAQSDLEPFPLNVSNLLDFCMLSVEAPTQRMAVEYLMEMNLGTVLCTDTLIFNCPVQNYCLEVASDTLVCAEDGNGYRLQMNVVVPDNNYTDDVGRVKVIVPGLDDPIMYDFTPALTAGESFGIDTLLTGLDLTAGDTLKAIVTAHDGPEERLCCFSDSLCLEVPDCTSCDGASIAFDVSEDECCWNYFITFPNSPPDIDSVWFLFQEFTGADFLLTELDNPGWQRITITPGEEYAYIPIGTPDLTTPLQLLEICTTPGGDNVNALISYAMFNRTTMERFCNFTGGGIQEACPAMPCDSLSATIQSVPDSTCAYDLFLSNTYTADPDLITSVTVNIIGGPDANFAGANLIPTAPGWDFASGSGGSYVLNPSDGAMPLGLGQEVFRFNVANSFSADSTYVEVAFLSGMDTLCRDTVAAICPGCITIVQDSVFCSGMSNLYFFEWVNHSPYPVNAVRVLETEAPNGDNLLNGQTHYLGEMVPIGGTFQGLIPVEFVDDGDGEFCFDIVLRQLVDGENPINCCFTTICTTVPNCDPGDEELCTTGFTTEISECPLDYQPICGCDGETYTNRCFADEQGVINWYGGPCPNTPPILPNFPIDGITPIDDKVILGTSVPFPVPGDLPDWYGFILQRLRPSDNTWWQIDATPEFPEGNITLEDRDPIPGEQTYRIVGVVPTGQPYLSVEATVNVPAMRAAITLSPNPTTEEVWVTSEHRGAATLEIISSTGQRSSAVAVDFAGDPVRVDLSRRAAGVHTVVVRFDDGRWGSRRVVVE